MQISTDMKTILLNTPQDTENAASELAATIQAPAIIFLEGQLGAGKTTFVKGFLRGCGYQGSVKSPTYTLIELYEIEKNIILHADLYRITDVNELDLIGFRDYFNNNTIALIEWASNASSWLPKPTMICKLSIPENGLGRLLQISECESE